MKRIVSTVLLGLSMLTGLHAFDDWTIEAGRADRYFLQEDYNAAWLFYERALGSGCDDGEVLFRAAESFRGQELLDDPELLDALYALSAHFLSVQYPDSASLNRAISMGNGQRTLSRADLRRIYRVFGSSPPRRSIPFFSTERGPVAFFLSQAALLRQFFQSFGRIGIRETLAWAKPQALNLLLAWLMAVSLSGIVLPVVMAVAVAREGRKSYVTAYAFLLHWGPLGIHRFYLGRYVSGIIWILTGGLLGIGVFFDLFLTGAYVRFWNEENREARPYSTTTKTNAPRMKRSRSKSPRNHKPNKEKAPRMTKSPKPSKPKRVKKPQREKPRSTQSEAPLSSTPDDAVAMSVASTAVIGSSTAFTQGSKDDFSLPDDTRFSDLSGDTFEPQNAGDFDSGDDFDFGLPEETALGSGGGDVDELPELDLSDDNLDLGDLSDDDLTLENLETED